MNISYKKWFSILGLLVAIIISLFIGLTFDLSILEGMAPDEEMPMVDDTTIEEEKEEEEEWTGMTPAPEVEQFSLIQNF
jgi:hypothetical protein